MTRAAVQASVDGLCRLSAEGLRGVQADGRAVPVIRTAEGIVGFQAKAGSSYQLTFGG